MKKFIFLFIFFIISAAPVAVFASSKNLILVCEKNFCKGSAVKEQKAFAALQRTMHIVEKKLQSPITKIRKPVEVHAGFDSTCAGIAPGFMSGNRPAGFTHYRANGQAVICLNATLKKIRKGNSAFAHELTHTYFDIGDGSDGENFEEILVRAATPCVKNCALFNTSRPKSMCSVAELTQEAAQFCKKHDLEYEKIPLLMKRLAKIRKNHRVTNDELGQELNKLSSTFLPD